MMERTGLTSLGVCDKLIEDSATLDVFDDVVAVFLLFVCVRDDAKIHDFGDVAMLDLFELFGVGKKSFFGFVRSKRYAEELDNNVFFLALFLFSQESAAGGLLAEQANDSIWPNVLWCCISHVAVLSSPRIVNGCLFCMSSIAQRANIFNSLSCDRSGLVRVPGAHWRGRWRCKQ